jgi:hypothetical protein
MDAVIPPPHGSEPPDKAGGLAWTIGIQEKTLDRIAEWIRAVDAKASVILAIDTGMIAIVVTLASATKGWTESTGTWVAMGSLMLIVSLLLVVSATFPQIDGQGGSLIFFGEIAGQPFPKYVDSVEKRSSESYLLDLNAQCYRTAAIANEKYRRVRYATIGLFVGLLPWLVSLFGIVRG